MASARRLKLGHILVVLAASGLALLAWTQVWVNATVVQSGSTGQNLEVSGSTAAPGVTALALAGLALAGALSIAGPVIRMVLGVLEVLLGFSVSLSAFLAVTDPAAASGGAVTDATGISGADSVVDAVAEASVPPWPFVALLAGVVMAGAGVGVVATARRWPGPTSRYQAVRFEAAEPGGATDADGHAGADAAGASVPPSDAVDDWDGLSRGEDPTAPR
ncbi:MAG TPA: Trp biosynthesis-associated membrane protein [Cryobacterium sp.]|nr:Trp biosynthesis-associated membrane protein [Cryobacterium sp.]